jgi:hypothetical protein
MGLLFENFFLSDLWLQKDQSADHQANSFGVVFGVSETPDDP